MRTRVTASQWQEQVWSYFPISLLEKLRIREARAWPWVLRSPHPFAASDRSVYKAKRV